MSSSDKPPRGFAALTPEQRRAISSKGGKAVHRRYGFAAMDPAKHRAAASKGGKSAHASGLAHEFTLQEARDAGAKGGWKPRQTDGE
jgi:general stress protein YciG